MGSSNCSAFDALAFASGTSTNIKVVRGIDGCAMASDRG